MDGDDERTDIDKDSERSQPESPRNNSKTNTNVTDSSSGENASHNRPEHAKRRRSSRQTRHRSSNREGLKIRAPQEGNPPKRKHTRRRRPRHNKPKHYRPYTKLSWEERMLMDEAESERATRKRADRPTPYNTTQFLMEDHKADTPDLSGLADNDDDTSEETFEDFRNGEYLEKNFSEAYDEVQSERLQAMTKEQLVNEVLALSKRVADLEESQRHLRSELGIESTEDMNSINPPLDIGLPLNPPMMAVPIQRPRRSKEREKSPTQ